MRRRSDANKLGSLEKLVTGLPASECAMEITVVYDDAQTHTWAVEVYQKIQGILGAQAVRGTWWNVADLAEPGVLAGAVSKAIRSDLIVVAVSCSEGLPLPFYFWVNAWLPHRVNGVGALVGLLAAPVHKTTQSGRLKRYLQSVARRARMDLMVGERIAAERIFHSSARFDFGN
jgi:hypothetical protein